MKVISRQWWYFNHSVMTFSESLMIYAGQCNCCRGGFRSRACATSSGCTFLLANRCIFVKMVIGMRLPTLLTLSIWRQRLWIWQSGWVFPPRSWMRRNSFVVFERLWVVIFLVNSRHMKPFPFIKAMQIFSSIWICTASGWEVLQLGLCRTTFC